MPSPAAFRRPTLLVFTRGPAAEARRRRLLPAPLAGAERSLHESCLATALDAGRAAGCRLLVASPVALELPADAERIEQRGGSFGERLGAALLAAGPGPVVVVGADVPDLTALPIERALAALAEDSNRAVVGPSPDGGFYLLAVAQPVAASLARVRWCRRDTAASLGRALETAGFKVVRLEQSLADLDRPADLSGWLAQPAVDSAHRSLRVALRTLFADLIRPLLAAASGPPAPAFVALPALRGPPR